MNPILNYRNIFLSVLAALIIIYLQIPSKPASLSLEERWTLDELSDPIFKQTKEKR